MLKYKGYTGVVQFDDEAMIFHGEVIGLRDVITFRGITPNEIKKEFENSIDGYLDWCRELGQESEKPFSGNIHLRLKPDVHAQLAAEAKVCGISLNTYINQALKEALLFPGRGLGNSSSPNKKRKIHAKKQKQRRKIKSEKTR